MLFVRISPAYGWAPSLLVKTPNELFARVVKLCRTAKSLPLVLTEKTTPELKLPPALAVPYRVLLDEIKPAYGFAPSAPPVKWWAVAKPAPSVLREKTVPAPDFPPYFVVPYKMFPDSDNSA